MTKQRDNSEEIKPLLLLDNDIEVPNHYYFSSSRPVIKGVVIQLAAWPSHILSIFIIASIIFITFIVATFIGIFFLSQQMKARSRVERSAEIKEFPNIYFVSHVNQSWTLDDLCAIESSAREYPDSKIYLINLSTKRSLNFLDNVNSSISKKIDHKIIDTLSEVLKNNINLKITDIIDCKFFQETILENECKKLNENMLEIAVKSHLIWQHFGVSLSPSDADQLNNYICRLEKLCSKNKIATLSIDGSILSSTVSCHAFYEYLLKKISSKYMSKDFIKDINKSYCPGQDKCFGVKIMSNKSTSITSTVSCPSVFPEDNAKSSVKLQN